MYFKLNALVLKNMFLSSLVMFIPDLNTFELNGYGCFLSIYWTIITNVLMFLFVGQRNDALMMIETFDMLYCYYLFYFVYIKI